MIALTPLEQRIEAFILQGMAHSDIAVELRLAIPTTKVYVSRVLGKRGARNMHHLTAMLLGARIREIEAKRAGLAVAS